MSTPIKTDLVVYGCTGYTGRLLTHYLANLLVASDRTFAIAGRSQDKMEKLLKECNTSKSIPIVIADASDVASLDRMCQNAKVVISCAGPFAKFGMPLVESCMRNGTHYVDITGEFPFVRETMELYHKKAEESGVFLVSCAGFDSVPSDMVNYFIHQMGLERNCIVTDVHCLFSLNGGPSRGTLESGCNITKIITKKDFHPNSLVPPEERPAKGQVKYPSTKGLWYNSAIGKFQAPFIMAGCNEKIVRRTNYLLGRNTAAYHESTCGSFIVALLSTVMMYALILLMIPFVQNLAKKYLFPAAGTGPSDEARKKSKFRVQGIGSTKEGQILKAQLSADRDAYSATGIFAAETALAIVCGETNAKFKGGVLTPAALAGDALLRRLPRAGIMISRL